MRIRLIIGLPGSGKTTFAQELAREEPGVVLVDDPGPETVWPHVGAKEIIVVDPNLCSDRIREGAKAWLRERYPGYEIEEIYFEADVAQCWENVRDRADGRRVDATMHIMGKIYAPPKDARPVWRR